MNSLKLTSTDLLADTSPGQLASRTNSQLSLHPLTSIGYTSQASLRLQGVATRLCPIGLWNGHEIFCVTVNVNSIDISRHFADAISALKSV
jgi:hypothetical protein